LEKSRKQEMYKKHALFPALELPHAAHFYPAAVLSNSALGELLGGYSMQEGQPGVLNGPIEVLLGDLPE
jgi:hypothetical protein